MGERTIANQKSSSLFELFSFVFLILFMWKGGKRWDPIQLRSVSIVAWKWACIFHFLFLIYLFHYSSNFFLTIWIRLLNTEREKWNNWLLLFLFFVCLSVCLCVVVRLNERAGRFKRGNSTDDPIASCSVRNGTLREARRWEVPSATTPTERSSFGSNVNR